MTSTDYIVTGMTCGHCGAAVAREVSKLPGVDDAVVDVKAGRLTIQSAAGVAREAVADAVDEAGYALVDA